MTIRLTCISTVLCLLSIVTAYGQPDIATDTMTIGERFQYLTGFGPEGYRLREPGWGEQVPLYKEYKDALRVQLPPPAAGAMTVAEAIAARRSIRRFADRPMSLEVLSRTLLSAAGITGSGRMDHRAAPSAGALYPVETYVIVTNVDTLSDGLYHFQVADSSLALIREGDFSLQIYEAANEQDWVGASPVTLVFTARFNRVTQKYADRGYRYAYIEGGAIAENVYLQAASLGLGTVLVGSFNDDALNEFLGVDGLNEAALLIMPVGWPE